MLAHDLRNELIGHKITEVILCFNRYHKHPVKIRLIDRNDLSACDPFAQQHAEHRGVSRICAFHLCKVRARIRCGSGKQQLKVAVCRMHAKQQLIPLRLLHFIDLSAN